jgi:uncharacterized membrane protein YgdD (TMEM256/DUF423 family)
MARLFITLGAAFAFLSVALGAFGAHALRPLLTVRALDVFETGARYQMFHALALLWVGLALSASDRTALRVAGWGFTLGILLFSGSLYTLALSGVTRFGAVAPLGGSAFLLGWGACLWAALRGPFPEPPRTRLGGGQG